MWPKAYKDYPKDSQLKKEPLNVGKGIIGCEMHELMGWGEEYHKQKKKPRGFLGRLFLKWFG